MVNFISITAALFATKVLALTSRLATNETNCCTLLQSQLGEKVFLRDTVNLTTVVENYWSAQPQQQVPACVVLPTTSADVSTAVSILSSGLNQSLSYCHFAIRSGGHTPDANINNIDDGVTLDLQNLNIVQPIADNTLVSVGSGNRWSDVYKVLDPLNLTVVGGRSDSVGVGGLLLSGGMSFWSAKYGQPCDNVLNYEIVLANGSIVDANATSYPDLYRALKGGSNNYGVVTRFDLRAVETGRFWGGISLYNTSSLPALVKAYTDFSRSDNYDPASQITLLHGIHANTSIVMMHQHYTEPVASPPEAVFANFSGELMNTYRVDSLLNFTVELGAPTDNGTVRKAFVTTTFKNNAENLQGFVDLCNATITDLISIPELQFISSYQPFGQYISSHASATGGNLLGLDASDGDRVLVGLTVQWQGVENDETMTGALQKLMEDAKKLAVSLSADDDYVFMNYASKWQDVYGGVGAANLEEFKRVSLEYDPTHLFQVGVPGGFKLLEPQSGSW